ncbi:phosphoenolpyruvate--protein phosphotransferase [Paenibacillus pasadenensis]|uniref:phosphoenolpyruvate--protein phosphotransferase n=1 Tax=Paenibacillus pasadenensis TaxID=217090 RepID=UPI00203E3C71|nr:phosphoenolpyruvate--protein phosphotransferase [Paenibacillus pasadenensis]MCM3747671.1 phosphoenolpyruvate--protein phosphotransferase [Paenibacillus pasadenensis]
MRTIQGIGAAPGYAIGIAKRAGAEVAVAARSIAAEEAGREAERFDAAVAQASRELEAIRERLGAEGREHEAEIFEAHVFLLEDEELVGAARERITDRLQAADSALWETAEEVAAVIAALDDPYLRERSADVIDVSRRVIRILQGAGAGQAAAGTADARNDEPAQLAESSASSMTGTNNRGSVSETAMSSTDNRATRDAANPSTLPRDGQGNEAPTGAAVIYKQVLIAADLTPSDTAQLDPGQVAGFATATSGRTSHSAIIARSVGVAASVGAGEALLEVNDGELLIVDGFNGLILINPPEEEVQRYIRLEADYRQSQAENEAFRGKPSLSADGVQVELAANIGAAQDAVQAKKHDAEGIGLFRTEFLYMGRDALPGEEEQYGVYRSVAEALGPQASVVIRTMDIGGDKELPLLELPREDNPFLGYRALRISLDRPELFKTQLRAILRASAHGNIKVMFPMVATLGEWRRAKTLLDEAREELRAEGKPFREAMEAGIMIEIPAAAMMADRLAREVDFFSIGTNDLVQYTMAADRMNPKLAYLSDPLHPPVLRLIDRVIRAAHAEGKWVGMCGEMAGNPVAVPLLLGMGLDEFSMSSSAILGTRALLSRLHRSELAELASAALELDSADEVRALVEERVPQLTARQ